MEVLATYSAPFEDDSGEELAGVVLAAGVRVRVERYITNPELDIPFFVAGETYLAGRTVDDMHELAAKWVSAN